MRNKDELKGKGKQIKGRIKDKVGEMTGNRSLEAEGEAERLKGLAQESVGRSRRKAGELMKSVQSDRKKKRRWSGTEIDSSSYVDRSSR
jgi:uncharacterized protein YjbJ (UPF0337 family)